MYEFWDLFLHDAETFGGTVGGFIAVWVFLAIVYFMTRK